jgi:hypothetical protein
MKRAQVQVRKPGAVQNRELVGVMVLTKLLVVYHPREEFQKLTPAWFRVRQRRKPGSAWMRRKRQRSAGGKRRNNNSYDSRNN